MRKLSPTARNLAAIGLAATVVVGCSGMAKQETMAPGVPFKDCPDCPEMVVVPAGHFVMGSPATEKGRRRLEGPQHEVTIGRNFAVGKYEVTLGQFRQFVDETGRAVPDCWEQGTPSEQHPVMCVTWQDASDYAQWLAIKTGKPYRLLSEAEWEYAARAGTTTSRYWGDSANFACKFARVSRCGTYGTAPVGQYKPNAAGLYDMMGNVWEWVEDCWDDSYTGAPIDGSARASGQCKQRVLRGGSFYNKPQNMRSASRNWNDTGYSYDDIGIRIARTLP
jgi:formylglycine-generating enzyme required for sulfatase activity